jgi:protein tyrosine phosphatase (PTP) superfamily phosphohydrolase (DUF442 family)
MWAQTRTLLEWKRSLRWRLHRSRYVVLSLLAVLAMPSAVLGVCLGLRFSENVHVVTPGLAYRSAQLLPEELESVIADYGIRSIISLTPPEPEQSWYQREISVSSAHQVVRYEVPLSRGAKPTTDQLQDLLSALREAPKPVLLHSQSGADRAGLAAAIFQYAIDSRPPDEAGRQLSVRYGHFPCILPETRAMDASFDEFVVATRLSGF